MALQWPSTTSGENFQKISVCTMSKISFALVMEFMGTVFLNYFIRKLHITQFWNHLFSYTQLTMAGVLNKTKNFAFHICKLSTIKQLSLEHGKVFHTSSPSST